MRREHEQAHGLQIKLFGDIAHGEEIALGLGHLFVVDVDKAIVHPVAHVGLAGRAGGLGDLVFMVREEQVLAAAVDVEGLAQVGGAHGRALDVPAGTAHAPGAFPRGLAGLLCLPESKVQRVLLDLVHAHARAALQILQILPAQAAIAGEGAHAVVHVALGFVGQSLVDEPLDERDDLRDVLRGAGMHRGRTDAQRLGVGEIFGDVALGNLRDGHALLVGAADHLVVDVGEVLHEGHFVAPVFQVAAQHVKDDEGARVSDVKEIIDRGPAGIDAHLSLVEGHERFLFPGHAVVNLHAVRSFIALCRPVRFRPYIARGRAHPPGPPRSPRSPAAAHAAPDSFPARSGA